MLRDFFRTYSIQNNLHFTSAEGTTASSLFRNRTHLIGGGNDTFVDTLNTTSERIISEICPCAEPYREPENSAMRNVMEELQKLSHTMQPRSFAFTDLNNKYEKYRRPDQEFNQMVIFNENAASGFNNNSISFNAQNPCIPNEEKNTVEDGKENAQTTHGRRNRVSYRFDNGITRLEHPRSYARERMAIPSQGIQTIIVKRQLFRSRSKKTTGREQNRCHTAPWWWVSGSRENPRRSRQTNRFLSCTWLILICADRESHDWLKATMNTLRRSGSLDRRRGGNAET
ncbi:hypothetical protein JTB14_031756 [Gonioctena quinquepunctata]|nr:hypothetical protein JTB14_031756 [Gonioctena quinquepunctata]